MSITAEDDDFEWEPPSEAEMKVIQARRERQDKISKLMGDYLLKGYKMLGECCEQCGTILLQDKQKKNYCVSCQELDSDIDKDNPALNAQAALSQGPAPSLTATASPIQLSQSPAALTGRAHNPTMLCAEEAVLQKMRWATQELQQSTSVEASIQLCGLIRSCADSLRSLRELQLS
ncbi:hypothetical protein AGOR_G00017930 [Albula goreensis]|uniref:Sjoegren syndrome/scleroderma autoantigen 1 n=1 Tax=Albula goreensis TaxID=1534307 RepID=A0A8T3E1S4_9TELE|nr:hypothetical protein AGOR_G00017930 [Albula goreensis]